MISAHAAGNIAGPVPVFGVVAARPDKRAPTVVNGEFKIEKNISKAINLERTVEFGVWIYEIIHLRWAIFEDQQKGSKANAVILVFNSDENLRRRLFGFKLERVHNRIDIRRSIGLRIEVSNRVAWVDFNELIVI